jgi:hypothetical protein
MSGSAWLRDLSYKARSKRPDSWMYSLCDRLKVDPLDQPHDELDTSLDILSRLAATAESAETIKEYFDLYPEFQPTPSR